MRRSLLPYLMASVLVGACSFTPSGHGGDVDASLTDTAELDGPPTDADGDGPTPIDAPPVDAAPDAPPIDAAIDAPPVDAAIDAPPIDAPPPIVVAYLAPADAVPGTADLALTTTTLNTDTLMFTTAVTLPAGVTLTQPTQQAGTDVTVLHVRDLTVSGTFTVRGGRPLLIIASGPVSINNLDANAEGARPGGGGFAGRMGPTPGTSVTTGNSNDPGGGGGGNGGSGGSGGDITGGSTVGGGAGGGAIGPGIPTELRGGSGGGVGQRGCSTAAFGGAGGGAIFIYSAVGISVTGRIHAGGGGGSTGSNCGGTNGGSGGGAGGHIDLQAPAITGGGVLAANGGGGSGAEGATGGAAGSPGSNATANSTVADGGGGGNGTPAGTRGGDGAAGAMAATDGGDLNQNGNTGGGGGGAGVIVLRYLGALPATDAVQTSPSPRRAIY